MATLALPRIRQWKISRGRAVAGVLIAWVALWIPLRGINTLPLAPSDLTPLHVWLNDLNAWISANRNSNPIFLYFFNEIRVAIDWLVTSIQALISQPAMGRPAPILGLLGVVAVVGFI